MLGRPQPDEAASYYSTYIDRIASDDVVSAMEKQLEETDAFLSTISEEKSLLSYATDKWTLREVLSHINDCERLFASRAFWFARGFNDALPGFDQEICVKEAQANQISWRSHSQEFHDIRLSTLSFFRHLPADGWSREGIANESRFTVRAIAYILAGHVSHHVAMMRERYL